MADEMNIIEDINELTNAFERRDRGTGQHIVYKPNNSQENNKTPIRIFFSSSHYRALLPTMTDLVLPSPYTDLFEMHINHEMLNAFFRCPSSHESSKNDLQKKEE